MIEDPGNYIIQRSRHLVRFNPLEKVLELQFRSEYLGWFVASVCFYLLVHSLLVIVIFGHIFGIFPTAFAVFTIAATWASWGVLAYFGTRLLVPPERLSTAVEATRKDLLKGLAAILVVLIIALNIGYHLVGIALATFEPIAPVLSLLFYTYAVAWGYDAARNKNALEAHELGGVGERKTTRLMDVISGKSEKKAIAVLFGSLFIGSLVSISTSVFTGLSVAASICGLLGGFAQFYPDDP